MPFIKIKSLPFEGPRDITIIIAAIGWDFVVENDIPLEHVHTTWRFCLPGHFAKGETTPSHQSDSTHSVLWTC